MQIETYEIMHMEKKVASMSTSGNVCIFQEQFMPYDLFLEEIMDADIDVLVNNLVNFYHWLTVTNYELAPDLSTKGCFPKAWIRTEEGFKLLKDGGEKEVRNELLASKICQCFDFPRVNQCFGSYDTIDGANCQTALPCKMTQKEAAIEAVKAIGLRQRKEIDMSQFKEMKNEAEMFQKRLNLLKEIDRKSRNAKF